MVFFYSVLNSFIAHPPPTTLPSNNMREVISIVFSSKAYDNINVSSIFRDTKISSYLPDGIKDKLPLKIFYSYDPPLSRKIFNYSSFLKVLDIDSLKKIVHKDCSCKTSPFCYSPHNHILTGDLSIIMNPKLRFYNSCGATRGQCFIMMCFISRISSHFSSINMIRH